MIVNVGDVIRLKWGALKGTEGKGIVNGKHNFIVTAVNGNKLNICPTSTKSEKVCDRFPYNIPLQDAKAANFYNELTHVKVDKRIEVDINDVYKKQGQLSMRDLETVYKAYNSVPSNRYIVIEYVR